MRKKIRGELWALGVMALLVGLFYGFKCGERPLFLRPFAWAYFDKAYYLKMYPEVIKTGMNPFDHYMSIGWREGKNPTQDFETTFYKNFYFEAEELRLGLTPLEHHMRALLHFRTEPIRVSQVNKKAIPLKNPKYYLTLVGVFRDEAPYLKEWIEFYRLQGVEHFYLYNHLSKDHYQEVLAPYIKEGIVELQDVVGEPNTQKEWDKIQKRLYDETVKRIAEDVEWLMVLDTDEFMYPLGSKNLKEKLKDYDDAVCVSVSWQMFGSGKVERLKPGQLLIEELTMASSVPDRLVKSVMKPRYVTGFESTHYPNLKEGYAQITEHRVFFKGCKAPYLTFDIFKINHYWTRDWDFFRNRKLERAHIVAKNLPMDKAQEMIKSQIDRNHLYSSKSEADILRFVPDLKKRMGLTS